MRCSGASRRDRAVNTLLVRQESLKLMPTTEQGQEPFDGNSEEHKQLNAVNVTGAEANGRLLTVPNYAQDESECSDCEFLVCLTNTRSSLLGDALPQPPEMRSLTARRVYEERLIREKPVTGRLHVWLQRQQWSKAGPTTLDEENRSSSFSALNRGAINNAYTEARTKSWPYIYRLPVRKSLLQH